MNFGELKTKVIRLMNRTDFTETDAAEFINQAQTRIERTLRSNAMENYVTFTATGGTFNLPTDFLELCDLWSGNKEIVRVDTSTWLKYPEATGEPSVFIQTGRDCRIRPAPTNDTELSMRYYSSQPALTTDVQENIWTASAVDALVYGACVYACDFFEDERVDRFAQRFDIAHAELKDQAAQEDFSGPMSIRPAYSYQD
jgi:hypothetical protein